jgi:hypothetical protein
VENAQNNNSFMHGRLMSGKMRREDVEWRDFGAKIIRINNERAFPRRGVRFGMASRPGAALLEIIGGIKL